MLTGKNYLQVSATEGAVWLRQDIRRSVFLVSAWPFLSLLVVATLLLGSPAAPAVEHGLAPHAGGTRPVGLSEPAKVLLEDQYGKTPLGFEENNGQTDKQVKFLTRGQGYTLFLTPSEAVLKMQRTGAKTFASAMASDQTAPVVLRMQLLKANANTQVEGLDVMASKSNYFTGHDRKINIAQYKKVKYHDIYPGIDLVYYGNQQRLEHDFIVKPGADPDAIRMSFNGADKIEVDNDGQLNIYIQAKLFS